MSDFSGTPGSRNYVRAQIIMSEREAQAVRRWVMAQAVPGDLSLVDEVMARLVGVDQQQRNNMHENTVKALYNFITEVTKTIDNAAHLGAGTDLEPLRAAKTALLAELAEELGWPKPDLGGCCTVPPATEVPGPPYTPPLEPPPQAS